MCASDPIVAHVVCSQADADSRFWTSTSAKDLKVKNLWLHVPWLHAAESREYFKDKRWTDPGLASESKKEFNIASDLVDPALARKVQIFEPWLGSQIGPFSIELSERGRGRHPPSRGQRSDDLKPGNECKEETQEFMNKVWLVTGSASGLGRNIAEAVLESGDRLVATARDTKRLDDLVKKYGDRVRAVPLDVTDESAAQAAVQTAVAAFGRLRRCRE